jgi:hypothetical protein
MNSETRVHDESLELTVNKNFGKIKIIDWYGKNFLFFHSLFNNNF